jgi:thiol-disulfide isomerase/thioredoxin
MNQQIKSLHRRGILAFIAVFALMSSDARPEETRLSLATPPFEATDAGGEVLHFPEELQGPAIVLFWASWCPYCRALMPHLQSIVDEYDGRIEVLALNFRDDEDPAEYLGERGFDFRLFPNSEAVAELWGVKGTPGLFLVDQNGLAVFSNFSIPEEAYPSDPGETQKNMKHYQKAARKAPFWAALLRQAIDRELP